MVKEEIKKYTEESRLTCANAFKVAESLGVGSMQVGNTATEMGVKIKDCDLGQFGKFMQEEAASSVAAYEAMKPFLDERNRINCHDARKLESEFGFPTIRATLKNHKIDVKYCKLGCFKEKKGKQFTLKTKIWIENSEGELLFGKGKTEVLYVISQTGSIKAASEVLDMNYKKCWNHLKILEKNFDDSLFETKPGGGKSAGTELKPKAYELMETYKQLEREIEEFSNRRFKELFLKK